MSALIYCKKCLTTNLRPNSSFSDGICIACQFSDINYIRNSASKLRELQMKIAFATKTQRRKSKYDCIVGVSGGKDSTRQAHWVRDRLGMRPLLVCAAYPPLQMSQIGADNLSNLITLGFDMLVLTPAPTSAAKLSLQAFRQFGNVCKSTELSLFSTVPRIAIEYGVPNIFWGENPALQVGDSAVLGIDEFDGNRLRNLNTLSEGGNDWIKESIKETYKVSHYIYPDKLEFEKNKINIFYLGAAWDDWSMDQNALYAALQGLTLRPDSETSTGDLSNASMLDEEFTNINMMLKYYKYGFGRATDLMNEQIRSKKITRHEAIQIVEEYDGVCDDAIIAKYCNYVGIDQKEFWSITGSWVNQDIFILSNKGRPKKKFKVGKNYEG